MNTYVPENRMGWWGGSDIRTRCTIEDKVAFPSQELAERSAFRIRLNTQRKENRLMQSYKGKCGNWHVGHGKKLIK